MNYRRGMLTAWIVISAVWVIRCLWVYSSLYSCYVYHSGTGCDGWFLQKYVEGVEILIVPPLALLAFGYLLRWVFVGFRSSN
jgi:hypothetical protein